jgi:hypothetical protein
VLGKIKDVPKVWRYPALGRIKALLGIDDRHPLPLILGTSIGPAPFFFMQIRRSRTIERRRLNHV